LSLDSPLHDPESQFSVVMGYIDISLTLLFSIEAIVKIIVVGFLLNGKDSYLRLLWNIIDFSTVVISIVSYLIPS